MKNYLEGLPTDKELSGKSLLLVAKTFEGEKFINSHTDVEKFCNFYKQKPKNPNEMINIDVYIGKKAFCTITAYWGTMHYYCVGSKSFEEMTNAMRQHCEDAYSRKLRWE